eukprot:CAMPEP_0118950178 /NCGR_PEP_ID=MMETSP1169-20130426/50914_1 /TAXON_ID=36882 /ORGANISM="Pyramimonas obovata, Strain CCMP722" /LENGTH=220 /DNA_ID=CAMNT_0006896963 /DNA_START=25 /DNA_END=684 /DNA_ORIENTATION=+
MASCSIHLQRFLSTTVTQVTRARITGRVYWNKLYHTVRQRALTTNILPYNVKRCWGLRHVPKKKADDVVLGRGHLEGGMNDPQQARPFLAIVLAILGVLLAFIVLSAVFSPGGDNFMKHPVTDLRVILGHPVCFAQGGLKGAVLCAAKEVARRQRTADLLLGTDKEQKVAQVREEKLTRQLEEQAAKYNQETEELEKRIALLERGLQKNGEELERKDQEL